VSAIVTGVHESLPVQTCVCLDSISISSFTTF